MTPHPAASYWSEQDALLFKERQIRLGTPQIALISEANNEEMPRLYPLGNQRRVPVRALVSQTGPQYLELALNWTLRRGCQASEEAVDVQLPKKACSRSVSSAASVCPQPAQPNPGRYLHRSETISSCGLDWRKRKIPDTGTSLMRIQSGRSRP